MPKQYTMSRTLDPENHAVTLRAEVGWIPGEAWLAADRASRGAVCCAAIAHHENLYRTKREVST